MLKNSANLSHRQRRRRRQIGFGVERSLHQKAYLAKDSTRFVARVRCYGRLMLFGGIIELARASLLFLTSPIQTSLTSTLVVSPAHQPTMTAPASFAALPLPIAQLSLAAVLKCGQSFRWSIFSLQTTEASHPQHEYRFCLRDRVVCLRQSHDTLFYRSAFPIDVAPSTRILKESETLAWLRDYFQLDIDLVGLYNEWSACDPVFKGFLERFGGIRILRQDPWENLVS